MKVKETLVLCHTRLLGGRKGITNRAHTSLDTSRMLVPTKKLYPDAAARSAPIGFLIPADLGDKVWRAAKAIGHVIFTSRKTSLRRDALSWPIRFR